VTIDLLKSNTSVDSSITTAWVVPLRALSLTLCKWPLHHPKYQMIRTPVQIWCKSLSESSLVNTVEISLHKHFLLLDI